MSETSASADIIAGLVALDDAAFEASITAAKDARAEQSKPASVAQAMAELAAAREARTRRPRKDSQ